MSNTRRWAFQRSSVIVIYTKLILTYNTKLELYLKFYDSKNQRKEILFYRSFLQFLEYIVSLCNINRLYKDHDSVNTIRVIQEKVKDGVETLEFKPCRLSRLFYYFVEWVRSYLVLLLYKSSDSHTQVYTHTSPELQKRKPSSKNIRKHRGRMNKLV